MLTETKEIYREVGKMGKFGILPGYGTRGLVKPNEKGNKWCLYLLKKRII